MADEKRESKEVRSKFKYVEQFAIQEEKNLDEVDSPKFIETNYFGRRYLHQIARVIYEEYEEETPEVLKVDDNGNPVFKKVKKTREKMGEIGGWIERFGNLSQDGECWVHQNAYILGYASVTGDVQVYPKVEIGDSAKVTDKAELSGYVCIKDQAYVYGEAQLYGEKKDDPVMVSNNARVCGRMTGFAKALGNAFVGADAEIAGKAKVYGNAMVLSGYVRDEAEVFGDAVVDIGPDMGNNVSIPMVRDNAKIFGAAIVSGGSVVGDSEISGISLVHAEVSKSKIGDVACIDGDFSPTDFVVRDSKISGNANFSNQGERGGGSRSEITDSIVMGNVRFNDGSKITASKLQGNVLWRGNLNNSKLYGNVSGDSSEMKALTNTILGDFGPGYPQKGCHVEGTVTNSRIESGVVKTTKLFCDSKMFGGVVVGGRILDSYMNSGVVLGRLSNAEVDGGVVAGSVISNISSHATLHMYSDYHRCLVVLSKCSGGSRHNVEVGKQEFVWITTVEHYEQSLREAEQRQQETIKELKTFTELLAMEDEERAKYAEMVQSYEELLAEEVEQKRQKLEEAKRKKKEADEEAARKAQEKAEEERRYQEEMDRRDKEMADALDSNGVDYEYAKIGDNRIFS